MSETTTNDPGDRLTEIMANFSDTRLLAVMDAAAVQLVERGLPLPHNVGALLTDNALEESRKLVNPLLEPDIMPDSVVGDGRVTVRHAKGQVEVEGHVRNFTAKMFNVFAVLAANADSVVPKGFILEAVWPDAIFENEEAQRTTSLIGAPLSRTRTVLGDELGHTSTGVIQTVQGVGWRVRTSLNGL